VVPTYNEAKFIQKKLNDLSAQTYPKELMEILVIDSDSKDETPELVEEWSQKAPDFNVKLIQEDSRQGKLHALNVALYHIHELSEVVIFTDADAFWERNALSKVISYFADPIVGSITGCINYIGNKIKLGESTYRSYYNTLRVAESKKCSTPIHNGPLLAIRLKLLRDAGLPNYAGSDDSAFGSLIAFMGYRAIQVTDVIIREPIRGSQFLRKVRRAQHLLLNFYNTRRYAKKKGIYNKLPFDKIWTMEWWLHVGNPWLFLTSGNLMIFNILFQRSIISFTLLGLGLLLLVFRLYRMWVLQQIYLILATLRNLWTKEVVWSK